MFDAAYDPSDLIFSSPDAICRGSVSERRLDFPVAASRGTSIGGDPAAETRKFLAMGTSAGEVVERL